MNSGPIFSHVNPALRLSKQHRDDLVKSGLSIETIEEAQLYSVPPIIFKKLPAQMTAVTSMLAFPYPQTDGFVRYKLFPPIGKMKYYQEKGSGCHLYTPKLFLDAISKGQEVYITEGEKKALRACQEGFPCGAVGGLWNWAIEDFNKFKFKKILFVPDNDVFKREDLMMPIMRLKKVIRCEMEIKKIGGK